MPTFVNVNCRNCNKLYPVTTKRYHESLKNSWRFYCSKDCLAKFRSTGKVLECANPNCRKKFYRMLGGINTTNNFCSASCSAIVTNRTRVTNRSVSADKLRLCANPSCNKRIKARKKYCSIQCFDVANTLSKERCRDLVIYRIKEFYESNKRIPYKFEMNKIYKHARRAFGTWNNAIIAAGLDPNPVKFAHKYVAKDGHKCDSLAEKIIDDWFYNHAIEHEIHVPYYGQKKFTADFLIGDTWIEFLEFMENMLDIRSRRIRKQYLRRSSI